MLAPPPPTLPPTLVVDGLAICAREGGRWTRVKVGTGWPRRGGMTAAPLGIGTVGAPRPVGGFEDVTDGGEGVYAKGAATEDRSVLFGPGRARVPRRVALLSPSNPVYRGVVAGFLSRHGVRGAKVRITRLVRTDLDGDGGDEVLIEASSRDGLARVSPTIGGGPGDYSLLLLRTVRGGRAVEIPLDFAAGRKAAGDTRLRAIADFDGDGRMEIVLSWGAWESGGAELWAFRRGRATRLAENGTGV